MFLSFFAVCMWRKIQEKGLSTLYVNDHLFRKNINTFLSQAFCPPGSVLYCFESFENYLIEKGQRDQIMEIFKYFKDNFIGRLHRNIRQQPLFAINTWNQFTRIMGNVPRANNVVEGWHRKQSLSDVKIDNTPLRSQNETNQHFKPTDPNISSKVS
ncbi:hypothetical protein HZS_8179 [Henneguya salminicola]|nr:hypothetical protein HZS_8179 [Henneguya salminicola]